MVDYNNDLEAFFGLMKSQDGIIVQETPKFDLESYMQNYKGRTRYDRLLLIGKASVPFCIEALKNAVSEAKAGTDVGRYKDAWDLIRVAAPGEPEAILDQDWIDRTERENANELHRLDSELKGYRNNLIKESIRMGNEDLGSHFEAVGSLHEATEAYSRMRHDVSTMRHIIDCSRHLISVSLQRRDWAAVISNVGKITGVQGHDEEQNLQPYVKIASGIGHLGMENYRTAALSFLHADSKVPASVYDSIASPSDVAMYGGLLALATMDRGELQSRVLENSSFRTFLEHEAQLRKAINFFVNGRYSNCLSSLESIRADCLLDLYLQRHVDHLYLVIRSKCIMQYIVPFSCVKLETMEAAFSVQDQSLEDELVEMIKKGHLEARIDSEAQVLITSERRSRRAAQQNALAVALKFEKEAKERLRRLNIVACGLESGLLRKEAAVDEWMGEDHVKTTE